MSSGLTPLLFHAHFFFFMWWKFSPSIIADTSIVPWWGRYQHGFHFIAPRKLESRKASALWILNAWSPAEWYDSHLTQSSEKLHWVYAHDLGQFSDFSGHWLPGGLLKICLSDSTGLRWGQNSNKFQLTLTLLIQGLFIGTIDLGNNQH